MGKVTGISWTNHTFNPWRGCTKISAGCAHCYAERDSNRFGLDIWGPDKQRIPASENMWRQPIKWNTEALEAGERRKVFCASFADVFEDRPEIIESRHRLWTTIRATPWLDWLILTKRPENVRMNVPMGWYDNGWPENVWIGTSCEDQKAADERIPVLLKIPASIRFLSIEPMIGPIDLRNIDDDGMGSQDCLEGLTFCAGKDEPAQGHKIDWVIVGGESGPNCRPMQIDWVYKIRDDCKQAGVAFFMKQLGGNLDKKGDLKDLPRNLQIRDFPR